MLYAGVLSNLPITHIILLKCQRKYTFLNFYLCINTKNVSLSADCSGEIIVRQRNQTAIYLAKHRDHKCAQTGFNWETTFSEQW